MCRISLRYHRGDELVIALAVARGYIGLIQLDFCVEHSHGVSVKCGGNTGFSKAYIVHIGLIGGGGPAGEIIVSSGAKRVEMQLIGGL